MARTLVAQGNGSGNYQLIVKTDSGSTVTAAKSGVSKTAKERNGIWGFSGLSAGTWTITCTKDGETAQNTVQIVDGGPCEILHVLYREIPELTYGGDFGVYDDDGNAIYDVDSYRGNWCFVLWTSGTLTISKLNSASNGVDIFGLGGGAAGGYGGDKAQGGNGGGGYYDTKLDVSINETSYQITIGAGGEGDVEGKGDGGNTTAFGFTFYGGVGGANASGSTPGTDGKGGEASYAFGVQSYPVSGTGYTPGANGFGQGGAGGFRPTYNGYDGGSGVVMIRNARG